MRLFRKGALVMAGLLSLPVMAYDLPSLGDSSSSIVSPLQEYQLGRAWLSLLRSQVAQISDPLVKEYIESTVYKLAVNSQLQNPQLEFIIIKSPELNAFAAPGGIIGVNGGLFLSSPKEGEYMGVLAHELAHLSQRHFARGVAAQQQMQIPMMSALLIGIIAAAAGSPEAGMATIIGSQAAAYQSAMSFSRSNEQEADRIGIDTLVKAGYDPRAMPNMFELLAKQYRYQHVPPEFLITHPVTESRIADTRNRAERFPKAGKVDSLPYQLIRTRIQIQFEETPGVSVKHFRNQLETDPNNEALRYGLALALMKNNQLKEAGTVLNSLLAKSPTDLYYNLAYIDFDFYQNSLVDAEQRIQKLLSIYPDSYPVLKTYVDLLVKQKKLQEASRIIDKLVSKRPNDPDVWYQASEVWGRAGNIVGVHQAQAEYLALIGSYDAALEQLKYARQKAGNSFQQMSIINQREKEIRAQQAIVKQFLE